MNQKLPYLKVLLFIIALFFSLQTFAQLPPFTFNVAVTNQTCLNNGVLTFSTSGTQPGAGITFTVYKLPDTVNYVIETTNTVVPGRSAGSYQIRATQSLNGQSSTNTQNVVIANNITPLNFGLIQKAALCGNDGSITVNVVSGFPASYQITQGPVLRPLQTSNVFTNLPAGLYTVRVFDTCGAADVKEQLVSQSIAGLIISPASSFDSTTCGSVTVKQQISAPVGAQIAFPIYIQVTVFPPGGGAPVVVNQTIAGGSEMPLIIPYYPGSYSYNIKATDSCGRVYNSVNNVLEPADKDLSVEVTQSAENCGDNIFTLNVANFKPPYTVSFPTSPTGFNPSALNALHPTFTFDTVIYGGSGDYAPEGNYVVTIVDDCGKVASVPFEVLDIPISPIVIETDANCSNPNGKIAITLNGRQITDVKMTVGPNPPYTGPFPITLNAYINIQGGFLLEPAPQGAYTFIVTDACGEEYTVTANIGLAANVQTLTVSQRPGCIAGQGSVKIMGTRDLLGMQITVAPTGFNHPLPYTVQQFVAADGAMYMNSLPAGAYTFKTTNECGVASTQNVNIVGYAVLNNNFTVLPRCGSFDLQFLHISNGTFFQGFYLQKFNATSNVWEHPLTGVDYVPGTQGSILNSILLSNNVVNPTLPYMGKFRVLKTFSVYDNGTSANIVCTEVLYEFDFDVIPRIIDAYSFPCDNGLTEVAIIAEGGVAPLTYAIAKKDGQPFAVNNGSSNIFNGLQSATYEFTVTDVCGYVRPVTLDIDALEPLGINALGFCEGEDSSLSVQEFSFLDYKWYRQGSPNVVLGTTGTLLFPDYESLTDGGNYILEITTDNPLSCMNQVLEYNLIENAVPNAGENIAVQFCNDGRNINLKDFLAPGISTSGSWEDTSVTGVLTNSTLTTLGLPEGTYQFKYTVAGLCNLSDDAMLTLEVKSRPLPPVVNGTAPVCEGFDLQLSADTVTGASYKWTGPNGFTSTDQNPLIANSTVNDSGFYSVQITVNGCPSEPAVFAVTVIPAPKAGLDGNSAPICNEGGTLDLTDYLTGTFDGTGTWDDLDGTGALNGTILTTTAIAQGVYQFRYTVTNACNITDDALITIELIDIPDAPTAPMVAAVCEGNDIQLSASSIANAVYAWVGPDGFTSVEQNPLIAAAGMAANGNYTVSVMVNGCASESVTVPVIVNAVPQFTLDGNAALCDGQTSFLNVSPLNFEVNDVDYKWFRDDIELTELSGRLSIDQTGVYKVDVTNNGCITSREITVQPNDDPFDVIAEAGCDESDYILKVVNIDDIQGAVVTWTGPGAFTFTGPEAVITNKFPGEYFVTVTNADGCTANTSVTTANTSCNPSRGLSPNGDGVNDFFDLSNLHVKKLKIFNRYGLKVYEADNYVKEWYGQSDKGTLPTATYYYVAMLEDGKDVTGWVYLQREVK